MTKRNLSIVSLLIQVLAIYPLFAGETFGGWNKSFFEYFDGYNVGADLVFVAYIYLAIIIMNCFGSIVFIFKNVPIIKSKSYILLSVFTLAVYVVVCLGAKFGLWFSWTNSGASYEPMYYIEVIILLFNILVECAKRYIKMPYSKEYVSAKKDTPADEIEKYKKLLDSGAISQEEFDIKKKELLGL